jgi:signal peptidase I
MISSNAPFTVVARVAAIGAVAGLTYVQPFRPMVVVGRSMEPTYRNHSFVLTAPVREASLKRGEVVVIDLATGPIVKRIAFMPGDKIMQMCLDNAWVDLLYVNPSFRRTPAQQKWRTFVVPAGEVYLLGDNQEVSYDSKQFGCVPMNRIARVLVDQRPFDLFPNTHRKALTQS